MRERVGVRASVDDEKRCRSEEKAPDEKGGRKSSLSSSSDAQRRRPRVFFLNLDLDN